MAIEYSEIEVYDDAECTTQVGSTIVTQSAATEILVDDTALGGEELILPGRKYFVKARVTNEHGWTSEDSEVRSFITAPYIDCQMTADTVPYLIFWCDFDDSVMSIPSWGVSISPNEDGTNAVNYFYNEPITDPSQSLGHKLIYGLAEHTEYFYVPFCMDSEGRYWQTSWDECNSFITKWFDPYVSILQASTTTDSITLTIDRQTNDPNFTKTFFVTGGKSVEVSNGVKGVGTYTIHNGDTTTHSSTISIQPDTTYSVQVQFATSDGLATDTVSVTTQPSPYVSTEIQIDSVTASQIRFYIDCETDDPNGLAYVELQYKKQGASSWTDLQVEVETGQQGAFVIPALPSSTYQIYLYAEDDRGEHQDSQTVTVTTPAS